MPRGAYFSSVDAAWLHMENPTNLVTATGLLFFDQPLDMDRLKEVVVERLCSNQRFRQRVRKPVVGLPRWEYDDCFDVDLHVREAVLPEPGDQAALQRVIADLMAMQLDPERPLWQMHLVRYGTGSALIVRLSHAIADGVALMKVLLKMTEKEDGSSDEASPFPFEDDASLVVRAASAALNAADTAMRISGKLLREGRRVVRKPSRVLDLALLGAGTAVALGRVALMLPDSRTMLRGHCGVTKAAAWSQPLRLDEVKAVGKAMGATVNDVVLSAASGALRRYLQENGEDADGVDVRAFVPVNIRPEGDDSLVGNRFGLVFLVLPTGTADPEERMRLLKQRMGALKSSPEAYVTYAILTATGFAVQAIENLVFNSFAMKGTLVMTNVAGPRERLYLAGRPIRHVLFWVPQPVSLGLGLSIMSYAGEIIVGLATDAGLVPDPSTIIQYFHDEYQGIRRLAGRRGAGGIAAVASAPWEPEHLTPLAEHAPDAQGAPLPLAGQCSAYTRSGARCRLRALPGQTTCHLHRKALREAA